ncbi:hypothetical protein PsorP6_002175 [Peronosclerospora sorghi]|uniref:Uncharacterized protein n=1 Tax=Peronosclerospora sorghi TaxID=230839 RepID=A0ACC0WXE9_9STRA|nr:hypothetical protein PsorP6_002175 [Peronosclerospora sorghi]
MVNSLHSQVSDDEKSDNNPPEVAPSQSIICSWLANADHNAVKTKHSKLAKKFSRALEQATGSQTYYRALQLEWKSPPANERHILHSFFEPVKSATVQLISGVNCETFDPPAICEPLEVESL